MNVYLEFQNFFFLVYTFALLTPSFGFVPASKERMNALLSHSYHWPKMELDIELYVKTCLICQQDKGLTQKEAGLLQPLPIQENPWVSISMDFITGLPKVKGMGSV